MQFKSIYEYPIDKIDFNLDNRQFYTCSGDFIDGEYQTYGWKGFSFYNIKGKQGCLLISMSVTTNLYGDSFIVDLKNNIAYTKNNQYIKKEAEFFSMYYPFCFGI